MANIDNSLVSLNLNPNSIIPIPYSFKAAPWKYAGAWYFASSPVKMAKEIRTELRQEEEGWGRLKATARIGNSEYVLHSFAHHLR